MHLSAVICAAGASTRLGQPKQLLPCHGGVLLQRVIEQVASVADDTRVVLGCHANDIAARIRGAQTLINSRWREGLATSLACAVSSLDQRSDALLIALCDQPRIEQRHYQRLKAAFGAWPHGLVASRYAGRNAVPAVFGREFFAELGALNGDAGARGLLQRHAARLLSVDCPDAAFDLDTPADLRNWLRPEDDRAPKRG